MNSINNKWSEFFGYICSMYSGEIARLLEDTQYKSLGEELRKTENRDLYNEIAERKMSCYYEQAALVALKHFLNLAKEVGIL